MPAADVSPVPLPGVECECWLLRFDKSGACVSPRTRAALIDCLPRLGQAPLILFSHGWNNDFSDASVLYAEFLGQLEALRRKYQPTEPKPVFVGVIWPSTWLSFDHGPVIAAGGGEGGADPSSAAAREEIAAGLADQPDRERLYALLDAPALAETEARELAALLARALADADDAPPEGLEASSPDADTVFAGMTAVADLDRPSPSDDDELPEGGTVDGGAPARPQDAGGLGMFDPRWAVRLASVYQMKDRAGKVGTRGVAPLVADLLRNAQGPIHAVGHSYGAKVVLSAVAAAHASRPIASMLLLQPAILASRVRDARAGSKGAGRLCRRAGAGRRVDRQHLQRARHSPPRNLPPRPAARGRPRRGANRGDHDGDVGGRSSERLCGAGRLWSARLGRTAGRASARARHGLSPRRAPPD